MAVGKSIEKRNHIIGFQEEIADAQKQSKDAFFTWFDDAKNADDSFTSGAWDFAHHIAEPATRYVKDPAKKTVLEIGHGGGRVLSAASRYFKTACGVDIHKNNHLVANELAERGVNNVRLLETTNCNIDLPDESVDLVYSFIVLQHVEKIDIFKQYLAESYRVLKPGGIAILYFARYSRFSQNRPSRALFYFDDLLEPLLMPKGYLEIPARVNEVNLKVGRRYVSRLAKALGYKVRERLRSKKGVPNGIHIYGGQNGLVLEKIT